MPAQSKLVTPEYFQGPPYRTRGRSQGPLVTTASVTSTEGSFWDDLKCAFGGLFGGTACAASKCWTIFRQRLTDPEEWEKYKTQCSSVAIAVEVFAVLALMAVVWFLSSQLGTAGSWLEDFRLIINTVMSKLKAAAQPLLDLIKWAVEKMWSIGSNLALSTGTNPMLWHANVITLVLWALLMVYNESELVLDDFYKTSYGYLVHELYTVFAYPENWIIQKAGDFGGVLLKLVVGPLMLPFKIGAFIFALPIAFFWGPLKIILSSFFEIVEIGEEEADKYHFHPYQAPSGSETYSARNDMVLPGDYPSKVCPSACE